MGVARLVVENLLGTTEGVAWHIRPIWNHRSQTSNWNDVVYVGESGRAVYKEVPEKR